MLDSVQTQVLIHFLFYLFAPGRAPSRNPMVRRPWPSVHDLFHKYPAALPFDPASNM